MKYKAIYDVIEQSGAHISYENSGWRAARPDYINHITPLWIVVEALEVGLRLWITHYSGNLTVTTARLDLDPQSREYHETQKRKTFRTQAALAGYLREILLPLEGGKEKCAS